VISTRRPVSCSARKIPNSPIVNEFRAIISAYESNHRRKQFYDYCFGFCSIAFSSLAKLRSTERPSALNLFVLSSPPSPLAPPSSYFIAIYDYGIKSLSSAVTERRIHHSSAIATWTSHSPSQQSHEGRNINIGIYYIAELCVKNMLKVTIGSER